MYYIINHTVTTILYKGYLKAEVYKLTSCESQACEHKILLV